MKIGVLLVCIATSRALHSAPARLRPLPSRRGVARATEAKPSERPGNYVQPYSSALGVSAAATICGELIKIPGSADAATPWLGRVAACTPLPVLIACFVVLRQAASVGPALLRTPTYERLNLGLAASCILACALAPMPVLPVIVARGGSALLCLEVYSQLSSTATAGNLFSEANAALQSLVGMIGRAASLLIQGSGAAQAYAGLALIYLGYALASCVAPPAVAALWPAASPGAGAMRLAGSSASLTAVTLATLADAADERPGYVGTAKSPRAFRWLNQALLISAISHLAVQCAAVFTSSLSVRALSPTGVATAVGAQLLYATVAVVCLAARPLWRS